jgi:hypothetical protein
MTKEEEEEKIFIRGPACFCSRGETPRKVPTLSTNHSRGNGRSLRRQMTNGGKIEARCGGGVNEESDGKFLSCLAMPLLLMHLALFLGCTLLPFLALLLLLMPMLLLVAFVP